MCVISHTRIMCCSLTCIHTCHVSIECQISIHATDEMSIWITPFRFTYVCMCMSCHVRSCHVMSCHVMSCHIVSYHVMSSHDLTSHHVMACHVMSCRVAPTCDTDRSHACITVTHDQRMITGLTHHTPSHQCSTWQHIQQHTCSTWQHMQHHTCSTCQHNMHSITRSTCQHNMAQHHTCSMSAHLLHRETYLLLHLT